MTYPYQITSYEDYKKQYDKSIKDPSKFWEDVAKTFIWKKKWDKTFEEDFQTATNRWFINGKLNITENCIDRHLKTDGNTPAIIWEPNNPNHPGQTITYNQLHQNVCLFAKMFKNQGVKKGDRVLIYMAMVPEVAYAMLALARIGAIHSVVFGGFSAQSIRDRLIDASASYIITSDGAFRGDKIINLKSIVDEALEGYEDVKKVIVHKRTHNTIFIKEGRDILLEDALEKSIKEFSSIDTINFPAEEMDSEDPLFILYTSGSTGKPKGVVHTTAGYMVYTTYTFVNVFQYKKGYIHFSTADVGWITGHSYTLYAPLCACATIVMYEGVPTWPNSDRLWDIIDKYKVNIFYTAPTVIRTLMCHGLEPFTGKDLSSLKVLGSVGEPINEEAWVWYYENVGKKQCSIVDTWWQTETGGILISNLAGITPQKPTWATLPLPGIKPFICDENGLPSQIDESGLIKGSLCIENTWPSIIRTTYNDHERCRKSYFTTFKNMYFTGDGALKDENGCYKITGRVDDVLNVSGHRIGTAELENAINSHSSVIECAVVGFNHSIKGEGIFAFVIASEDVGDENLKKKTIQEIVAKLIGPIAKPDKIRFCKGLPKTRSGKIVRRILRKIANEDTENLGDISTLIDPSIVDDLMVVK
jgi:acetyl-CoA synthetase